MSLLSTSRTLLLLLLPLLLPRHYFGAPADLCQPHILSVLQSHLLLQKPHSAARTAPLASVCELNLCNLAAGGLRGASTAQLSAVCALRSYPSFYECIVAILDALAHGTVFSFRLYGSTAPPTPHTTTLTTSQHNFQSWLTSGSCVQNLHVMELVFLLPASSSIFSISSFCASSCAFSSVS